MSRAHRIWRHFNIGTSHVRRAFPPATLHAIEEAVRAAERHGGQVRFAVEDSLPLASLWRGMTPRQRAIEKFGELGVWDTAHNDGVLIYVLFADRDVEIVADRGVAGGQVSQADWEACCRVMEGHFREGRFREGAVAGVEAVARILARHPAPPDRANELPDRPAIL